MLEWMSKNANVQIPERQMPLGASEMINEIPFVPGFPVIQGSFHCKSGMSNYESLHPCKLPRS